MRVARIKHTRCELYKNNARIFGECEGGNALRLEAARTEKRRKLNDREGMGTGKTRGIEYQ